MHTLSLSRSIGLAPRRSRRFGWKTLRTALKVQRERQVLASLDDAALADMGLTRAQAEREASRSFWDLPENR